jgi:hypothetical protein
MAARTAATPAIVPIATSSIISVYQASCGTTVPAKLAVESSSRSLSTP